jgi:hypothetical protein
LVKLSKAQKLILLAALVAAGVFVALRGVWTSGTVKAIAAVNLGYFLAALAAYLATVFCFALRWRVALGFTGRKMRVRDLWLVLHSSIFINNLTPMTYAGGDPIARGVLLKKVHRVPYSTGVASILGEYLLEYPVSFSFVFAGVLLALIHDPLQRWAVAGFWLATVLVFFSAIVFVSQRRGRGFALRIAMWANRVLKRTASRARVEAGVDRFYSAVRLITGRIRAAVALLACSLLVWSLALSRLFFVFMALGYQPGLPVLLLGATLPPLAGVLPLLPAGLGLVDATYVSVFTLLGVPFPISVLATILDRIISLVFGTLIGAATISYLGVRVWVMRPWRPGRRS